MSAAGDWDGAERRRQDLSAMAVRMEALHQDVTEMKTVLRDLITAITKLAVVEERQLQTAATQERIFSSVDRLNASVADVARRVGILEQKMPEQTRVRHWVDNAVWAAAGVAVMLVLKKVGVL